MSKDLFFNIPPLATTSDTKKITVIIEKSDNNEENNKMLESLLAAIKQQPSDIKIIECNNAQLPMIPNCEYALLFLPIEIINKMPLNVNYYQPYQLDACTILISEKLSTLQDDKQKKVLLWKALQQVFLT